MWSATTDDGPFNGLLERPALRSLIPRPLAGRSVLDAGCGSGAQCAWLLGEGADVTGLDLSPAMVDQARQRCGSAAKLMVADLADDLPLEPRSFDGVTCSLALHYLRDWQVPLASFARILRPGGLGGHLAGPSLRRATARSARRLLSAPAGQRHLEQSGCRSDSALLETSTRPGCRCVRRRRLAHRADLRAASVG